MNVLARPDGHVAWWQDADAGPVTIVWVHGLPLDSHSWHYQAQYFGARARNVFLDLRGYGASSKLPQPTGDVTQLYVDDLQALLETLDVTDAVLVGFASGGHVVLRYAARHPRRVGRLVTINASPRFRRGPGWPWGFRAEDIDRYVKIGREEGISAMIDTVLARSEVFRDVDDAHAARLTAWFRPMGINAGVDTLLGFFERISLDDDRDVLGDVTAPTLILASTAGREVPSSVGLYLRQHIPNAQMAELPGADHFAFATRPALVNLLIEQILPSRGRSR